ncbi:MAG: peptide chain release factor 2 [bacterium]|nr:peptide chain release factor 2 [bacterium]
MLADIRSTHREAIKRIKDLRRRLDPHKLEIEKLEGEIAQSDFWNDPDEAQKVMQRLTALKAEIEPVNHLIARAEDIGILLELAEEDDTEIIAEMEDGLKELQQCIDESELSSFLNGKHDRADTILTVHAGAGGTESCDWAEMLLRMYLRWAEKRGYGMELTDITPGDGAGIRSVTIMINGFNAFGHLKCERGVHRLVRISPFDAAKRRHTSFASVEVIPQIEEEIEVSINSDDLRIDTYRAAGAGGQHVNKTDSAVRITHLPTGIVAQCQSERSQHQNRETAIKILKARLYERQMEEKERELAKVRGQQKEIAWGSQIRSYVFHPYSLVKDHRTGEEVGNVQAVMDGELDRFIWAYLKQQSEA